MEAGDATRADVDRQRQPRALDRRSRHAVDHDHVDQRVIDLDQRQRPVRFQRPNGRQIAVAGGLAALSLGDDLAGGTCPQSRRDRLAAWNGQTFANATAPHLFDQVARSVVAGVSDRRCRSLR